MKNITAYIPCHNADRFIGSCVKALLEQSLKPSEILVINDGSTDRTVEKAKRFPVKVIHLEGHPGLADARNSAIKAASHDYIASIDADCVPESTWLECLMNTVAETGAAGAGGKLVEAHQERLADRWRAVHMRQNWGDARVENPPFLFGCNTLFRKSALDDVGGYNAAFRSNGEDVDISKRLMKKGHTLTYEPSAIVRHLKQDTMHSVLKADWNWGYVTSGDTVKFESNANIVYHNFTNAKYRFLQDAGKGQYSLIPMDILLFFFHVHWDILHAQKACRTRPSPRGIRSRIETLTAFHAHLAELSEMLFLQNPESCEPGVRAKNKP